MKFLIPIILISILSLSFISKNTNTFQTDKNGLTVKEFISFFENRNNPDAVDKEIGKKEWIYVSSEKHGTTQVDMWMFEIYYHDVQYIMQSIFSPEKGLKTNQLQLHFQHRQPYEDFVAQFVDSNLDQIKQEKKGNIYITHYANDKYFVYTIIDRSQKMPYRVTIAELP
ncbi:hypothetical protein V9L05_04855 [Bernardetia sp. Wsw4-3y2]|uniref:hypothetical protein n=1 Tax=Bernardetia sp. Wsw4-3y2 TaxID=3127471 RepID=UPI0030CE2003